MTETIYSVLPSRRRVRKAATVPAYSDGDERLAGMTPRGESLVAQAMPERAELSRLGAGFGAAIPTASAFTFVATPPTTRSELVLYNGEPAGGKTYVVERAWLANVTSQGAAQHYSLQAQIAPASRGVAAPADDATVLRRNLSGRSTDVGSNARLALADATFAVADQWFALGRGVSSPMTTNLGGCLEAPVCGRYLIPPGAAFLLAGIAGTAAGSAICGLEWCEVAMQL